MDLAELRMRSARQGAKALSKQRSKTRLQIYYKTPKSFKALLTYDIIESERKEKLK
jgi:hypothetical protein